MPVLAAIILNCCVCSFSSTAIRSSISAIRSSDFAILSSIRFSLLRRAFSIQRPPQLTSGGGQVHLVRLSLLIQGQTSDGVRVADVKQRGTTAVASVVTAAICPTTSPSSSARNARRSCRSPYSGISTVNGYRHALFGRPLNRERHSSQQGRSKVQPNPYSRCCKPCGDSPNERAH